jgi:hypothetical protein
MMGIAPIKYSDIFSRANNLININISDHDSFDFGFTAEEVKEKLRLVLEHRKVKFIE